MHKLISFFKPKSVDAVLFAPAGERGLQFVEEGFYTFDTIEGNGKRIGRTPVLNVKEALSLAEDSALPWAELMDIQAYNEFSLPLHHIVAKSGPYTIISVFTIVVMVQKTHQYCWNFQWWTPPTNDNPEGIFTQQGVEVARTWEETFKHWKEDSFYCILDDAMRNSL